MPNFTSIILEEMVTLTPESVEEIDSLILKAIRAKPLGKPIQILVLTEDELNNYQPENEELAHERCKKIYSRLKEFKKLSIGLTITTDGNQGIITLHFDNPHNEELFKAQYLNAQEIFLPLTDDQILLRIKEALNSYSSGPLKIDAVSDEEARLVNQRLQKLPHYEGRIDDPQQKDRLYLRYVAQKNQIRISNWFTAKEIQSTALWHQSDTRIVGLLRQQIACNEIDIPKLRKILEGSAIPIPPVPQVNLFKEELITERTEKKALALPEYISAPLEKEAFIKLQDSMDRFKSSGLCTQHTADTLDNLFLGLVAHAELNKKDSLFLVEKLTKLADLSASESTSKENLRYFKDLDSFIVNKKSSNSHLVELIVVVGIGFIIGAAIGAALTAFAGGVGAFGTAQLGAIIGLTLVSGFGLGGAALGGSLGKAGFFSSSSESESNKNLTDLVESAKKSFLKPAN